MLYQNVIYVFIYLFLHLSAICIMETFHDEMTEIAQQNDPKLLEIKLLMTIKVKNTFFFSC